MKKNKIIYLSILIFILIILSLILLIFDRNKTAFNVSDRTSKINEITKEGYPVMGWIRVQGTNIDYPILYSQDSNYPLENVDIDFAWTNSSNKKRNTRVLVSGHNIRNVSSKPLINNEKFNNFENLPSYLYYDFVKKNKYIQYTINNKNYIYKIYSVSMIPESKFSYDEYMDANEKESYIEDSKKDSYFNFNIDVDGDDDLITLTTCTRFFGDKQTLIKIDGRLLRNGERIVNYKVSKKSNYSKIEKTMKGDGQDDKKA